MYDMFKKKRSCMWFDGWSLRNYFFMWFDNTACMHVEKNQKKKQTSNVWCSSKKNRF
jgi:hypothetical protein